MPNKTITRADLATAIHQEIGIGINDCSQFVNEALNIIGTTLANGEEVKISNFGIFTTRQKNERVGRNPKTGEDAVIAARRVVKFKPSHELKKQVTARAK